MDLVLMSVAYEPAQGTSIRMAGSNATAGEDAVPPDTTIAGPAPDLHVSSITYNEKMRWTECSMNQFLPGIASDPEYGLNGAPNSRLVGFSEGQYTRMSRESSEKQGSVNTCSGINTPPYWSWIEYNAIISQMSPRPVSYNLTLYAYSQGRNVPVLSTTAVLNPGRDYPFKALIPLRSDQRENLISLNLAAEPGPEPGAG
jgi:hypothetical protein